MDSITGSQKPTTLPVTKRLPALIGINPGEGVRVAWMILYSVAAIGGFLTVGLAVGSALFLSALPAAATPFVFIYSGISSVVVFLLYSLAVSRLPMRWIVIGSNVLLLLIALVLRILLGMSFGHTFPVLLALFLFIDAGSTLVIAQFWVQAARIFDPREAKRLFGLMSAGGTASAMLASLGLRTGVSLIGVDNLLLVVAGALALCILCDWALGRSQRKTQTKGRPSEALRPDPPAIKGERASLLRDLRAILRSPLLLAISAFTVLTALLINTGAYQFFLALQAIYSGRSREMVEFLGAFGVVIGLAALFVQLYLTRTVMRRMGVFGALVFFPLAMALGAGLGVATGGALLAMALVRAADPLFRQTINSSAMAVLYLPVQAGLRQRAKTILEIVYAVSFGLLGFVFLFSQRVQGWSYTTWSFPVLGFAILWILLLRWGQTQYRRALAENLKKRRLDFANSTYDISDETTIRVLATALRGTDELLVVHTLDLISQAPKVDWVPYVAPLLGHPSAEVRLQALRHLSLEGTATLTEQVTPLLDAPESEVRAQAIGTLCTLEGRAALDRIGRFLQDKNPKVRGAALSALGRHGGGEWEKTVASALKELLESNDPDLRMEGARALAALGRSEDAPRLGPLFDVSCPARVRASAIRAAGVLRNRDLLPHLIAALGQRAVAAEASEALACYGTEIGSDLCAALIDTTLAPTVRAWIASLLGRLRGKIAAEALGSRIREPDAMVRAAVLAAMAGMGPFSSTVHKELHEELMGEIRNYYTLVVWHADLCPEADSSLIDEALRLRERGCLDRICLVLGLLYPDERISNLRQALDPGNGKARAMAIELLDTMLSGETKTLLIPALEAPEDRVRAIAGKRFGIERQPAEIRLAEVAAGNDPWLRTCARHRLGGTMALPVIERVLFLKGAELFSQLAGEDLLPLAQVAQEVHFQAGETFIHQDEPGSCLYLIVDGEASIVVQGIGQIGTRGPKGAIGEMAIIWRRPRSADCLALTDVTALRIEHDDFWELMDERPALAQGVIKVLALRLDQVMENLQRAGQKQGQSGSGMSDALRV
jgi:AAA family ATP:ADP antiporter